MGDIQQMMGGGGQMGADQMADYGDEDPGMGMPGGGAEMPGAGAGLGAGNPLA